MRKTPGKQTVSPFSFGGSQCHPFLSSCAAHICRLRCPPAPFSQHKKSWIQYLPQALQAAWMAVAVLLSWPAASVTFCPLIKTPLCHRNEQQSYWKRFLESRDVVSAAAFPLCTPRVRGWKCYLMEQQALLNTWWARSSQGKSVSITFYFKTPKPFAAQCCTFWLCHRIAATISRSVGLQHCPGAVFSQGSMQFECQTHHSK